MQRSSKSVQFRTELVCGGTENNEQNETLQETKYWPIWSLTSTFVLQALGKEVHLSHTSFLCIPGCKKELDKTVNFAEMAAILDDLLFTFIFKPSRQTVMKFGNTFELFPGGHVVSKWQEKAFFREV